ncbi:MAG: hypothetical protein EOP54_22120, partial [Sphingobacteriales bacterium]
RSVPVPATPVCELGVQSLNVDFTDFTNQLYIQTIFAQRFLLGGGAEYKHIKIKSALLIRLRPNRNRQSRSAETYDKAVFLKRIRPYCLCRLIFYLAMSDLLLWYFCLSWISKKLALTKPNICPVVR